MERYLNDLKMKWRTSLDLLAEEVNAPYGAFIRFLPESWEIFATNTKGELVLPIGIRHRGRPSSEDLSALSSRDPFYRLVDLEAVDEKVGRFFRQTGITHCCGFSVDHGSSPFGLLFLGGRGPFEWDSKRETFLLRFKTILEEDLAVIADKARYLDELTRTKLGAGDASGDRDGTIDYSVFPAPELAVHPSTTPILPLMDDIHRSHESYMPRDVKLITRIRCPSDYALFTDGFLVKQILSRLLVDAESRTSGGEIKVECRLDEGHRRFLFSVYHPEVSHGDYDILGDLDTSRYLSERLGGRLTAENRHGKGIGIVLSLPLGHHIRATA